MTAPTAYVLVTLVHAQGMLSIITLVINTHQLLNHPEICQSHLFFLIYIFHLDNVL